MTTSPRTNLRFAALYVVLAVASGSPGCDDGEPLGSGAESPGEA